MGIRGLGKMGESLSKDIQPEELAMFKKMPTTTLLDNIQIPERPQNRRPTDLKFLYIFIGAIVILLPFLIYTMVMGDLNRMKGYDQCGNICGKKNSKYDQWECTGKDLTAKPYLQYDSVASLTTEELLLTRRKCVDHCESGYTLAFGVCWKNKMEYSSNSGFSFDRFKRQTFEIKDSVNKEGKDMSTFLSKNAWRIVLSCFLSLGVTLAMLFLFRSATAAVVWGILGGVFLFGAVIVGGLWYLYFHLDKLQSTDLKTKEANEAKGGLLYINIFLSVFFLILFCVMVFMYKKIQLVIQLLKETTKAIFAMPLIIFTPLLTFLVSLIVVALLVFNSVYMFTSGSLTELKSDYLYYKENPVMMFTMIFNYWMAFWSLQFIVGIQYMVIAGAVATWYWSKNKNHLDSPIGNSIGIVFRFHLGSIAFGSLVITLMAIIRSLISSLAKNKNLKMCVDFCLGSIEAFLKFLSKNSYILTAMHGKPFYKSGKRAAKIIFQNAVNISSVNYIGDFVLGMAQLLIIIISLLLNALIMWGTDSEYAYISYIIVFLVSLVVAITFFSPFETTIDTIFLCFCEDSLLNDGMARPYAMSRDLMEFVENSKKVLGENKN
ncbi:hypothetical protein JTB14_005131 [Gonioctena quinquepunctata]|nr:hypothetical protein JTB14_005131 [Gonioctena quinquepunctata]